MTYKEISELIKSRQSLYPAQMDSSKTIAEEDIWKLLELANYAPNHKRTEPWRFTVFSGEAKKELFQELIRIYKTKNTAENQNPALIQKLESRADVLSHIITISVKRDEEERIPVQEEEYAVACAVQNMLLAMDSLNIAGYWASPKMVFTEEFKSFLELGEKDVCMGFLQLGVKKANLEIPIKSRQSAIQSKVTWK